MTKVKNISIGPRGIRTVDRDIVMLEAGETADLDLVPGEASDDSEWFEFDVEEQPKALGDYKVAELRAIAEAEGVDLGDAAKKADIVSAIELAREEAGDGE